MRPAYKLAALLAVAVAINSPTPPSPPRGGGSKVTHAAKKQGTQDTTPPPSGGGRGGGARILFFGDSMVERLRHRLQAYAEANGHQLTSVCWYSSSTKFWAEYDTLEYYLRRVRPTYIIVTLGGNEFYVRDLPDRVRYIRRIREMIGRTPAVWIGPPNWREDTGINKILEEEVGTDAFFPTYRMSLRPDFERSADGHHPTPETSARWVDSVAAWLPHSRYPLRLSRPTREPRGQDSLFIIQPPDSKLFIEQARRNHQPIIEP